MPLNERTRRDLRDGAVQGGVIAAVVLAIGLPVLHVTHRAPPTPPTPPATAATSSTSASRVPDAPWRRLELYGVQAPGDVLKIARWVVADADNGLLPFAIIDKRRARLYVFEAVGSIRGDTPILLGYAAGDESVGGIGSRPIDLVRPQERTTPAGRFVARLGRNTRGEDVVWVDYDAAVSMHRVLTTHPQEHRLERLASPRPGARRISWGCINVPAEFFDDIVWPLFSGEGGAVVYVLPEQHPLQVYFPRATAGVML